MKLQLSHLITEAKYTHTHKQAHTSLVPNPSPNHTPACPLAIPMFLSVNWILG